MQSRLTLLLLLGSSAYAQTVHEVVATDGVEFEPNSLSNVAAGDMIKVTFSKVNHHDIVSGSWASPCEFNSAVGLNSGVYSNGEVFEFTVNSTDPQIFFCAVGPHCQLGMSLAVNPSGDETIEAYQTASKGKEAIGPTSEGPVGGTLVGTMTTASSDDPANSTTTTTNTTTESTNTTESSNTTNTTSSPTPTASSSGAAAGFGASVAMIGALVVGAMAFVM